MNLADPMDGSDMSWEEYYFKRPLIVAGTNLSMYQSTVRMIEIELLREMVSD